MTYLLKTSLYRVILNSRFYQLVFLNGVMGLFLLYQLVFARGEAIASLYSLYHSSPLQFTLYVILELLGLLFFGASCALAVYSWREKGIHLLKEQASTLLALVAGAFGTLCVHCVEFLLSVFGLPSIPLSVFESIEFTFLSVLFLGVTVLLSYTRIQDTDIHIDRKSQSKIRSLAIPVVIFFLFIAATVFLGVKAKEVVLQNTTFSTSYTAVSAEVLPSNGIQTRLVLGNIVPTMVSDGIIDMNKMQTLYKNRGGIPTESMQLLIASSSEPLTVTAENAPQLVNILWAIGLSNKMEVNLQSPIVGKNLNHYASTGGWQLGRADTGGEYFNKFPLIPLTLDQQKHVQQIAQNTYRPCCDNSTFYQDCNHGSAAMAIIELGVSEGLSDTEIYKTLLAFNSYWFPQNYIETALYFKIVKGIDWKDVDPKLALSKEYSSVSGWLGNVDSVVSTVPGLLPQAAGGGRCAV
jgi:hypothetical protein